MTENDNSSEVITDEPFEGEPDEKVTPQSQHPNQDDEHDPEWDHLDDELDYNAGEMGPVAPAEGGDS